MKQIGISKVGDIGAMDISSLEAHFGRYGSRLYELARGIDHNPVVPNRVRKQISAEDTFERDIPLKETELLIRKLAEKVWNASSEKYANGTHYRAQAEDERVQHVNRSLTPAKMPTTLETFIEVALSLRERVELGPQQLYRLVGVGLGNFQIDATDGVEQTDLPGSSLFNSEAELN